MFRVGTVVFVLLSFSTLCLAADLYVATTGTDHLDCGDPANPCLTIQYVIDRVAASGDVIHVAEGDFPDAVEVNKSLIIEGEGALLTSILRVDMESGVELSLHGLTTGSITNDGGTLYVTECRTVGGTVTNHGTATLVNSSFSDSSGNFGNYGDLTVIGCTFSEINCGCTSHAGSMTWLDSTWEDGGHGLALEDGADLYATNLSIRGCWQYGLVVGPDSTALLNNCSVSESLNLLTAAVLVWDGRLTLNDTSVSHNLMGGSSREAALYVGGDSGGTVSINNCTISGNTAEPGQLGSAIWITAGDVTLNNSTVSGNTAPGDCGGVVVEGGSLHLDGTTITANQGLTEGGLCVTGGEVTLANSIIGLNLPKDGVGPFTSEGYNLITDSSGFTISGDTATNLIGLDPLLGPLQDNGGATYTHALLPSSPAIDAGNTAGCGYPSDQRGECRHTDGLCDDSTRCDMGAYELAGCLSTLNVLEATLGDMSDAAAIDTTWDSPYAFDPPDGGLLYYQIEDGHGFPAVIKLEGDDSALQIHF